MRQDPKKCPVWPVFWVARHKEVEIAWEVRFIIATTAVVRFAYPTVHDSVRQIAPGQPRPIRSEWTRHAGCSQTATAVSPCTTALVPTANSARVVSANAAQHTVVLTRFVLASISRVSVICDRSAALQIKSVEITQERAVNLRRYCSHLQLK